MNLDCNSNMNAIKINSKFDGKRSNNSAGVGLNFQAVFYVFMPVANIESSFVTGSSLKRALPRCKNL